MVGPVDPAKLPANRLKRDPEWLARRWGLVAWVTWASIGAVFAGSVIALVGVLLFGEPLGRDRLAGLAVALLGMALVVLGGGLAMAANLGILRDTNDHRVGVLSVDDEDGDRSFNFSMAILDTDLDE